MLTGYADNETTQKALDLGANEIMRKPFDLVKLISRLSEMTKPSQSPVTQGSIAAV